MYPNKKLHRYLVRQQYVAIPIHHNENRHQTIAAAINGLDCCLVVDTGASHSCLDFVVATDELLLQPSTMEDSRIVGLGNIDGNLSLVFVQSLCLGALVLKKRSMPVIDLGVVKEVFLQTSGMNIHGILGADVLEEFGAIVCYENNCLYLKQAPIIVV